MSLLEFAEDRLGCEHVVVCLSRADVKTSGNNNAGVGKSSNAVKNFLFLGFQPLAPGHEFLPPNNANLVSHVHSATL